MVKPIGFAVMLNVWCECGKGIKDDAKVSTFTEMKMLKLILTKESACLQKLSGQETCPTDLSPAPRIEAA